MTTLVERTIARCTKSRSLVAETNILIALSWRIRNGWAGIGGASDEPSHSGAPPWALAQLEAQTRPCPRPGCGREVPIRRYRYETLRQIGWPLFRVARFVNWCGHAQELIPVPDDAEWVRLVPVIGTAK